MPRITNITIPVQPQNGRDTDTAQGYVAHLDVGGAKEKFFIQQGPETYLTHFATGRIVGNISRRRLGYMASYGTYSVPSDRSFAQRMLDEIVTSHGADAVRAEFQRHPVLNPE